MESSLSDLCFQSFPKHSALSADVWSALSISLQVNLEKTWPWICEGYMEDTQPEVSVLWCRVLIDALIDTHSRCPQQKPCFEI